MHLFYIEDRLRCISRRKVICVCVYVCLSHLYRTGLDFGFKMTFVWLELAKIIFWLFGMTNLLFLFFSISLPIHYLTLSIR